MTSNFKGENDCVPELSGTEPAGNAMNQKGEGRTPNSARSTSSTCPAQCRNGDAAQLAFPEGKRGGSRNNGTERDGYRKGMMGKKREVARRQRPRRTFWVSRVPCPVPCVGRSFVPSFARSMRKRSRGGEERRGVVTASSNAIGDLAA